jgi:threonine/homoserine/homoserine lactone efflux protein
MDVPVLLRGVIVGFGIAAPVGPIGLLVVQRTLVGGRLVGLLSGLGAATADTIYGLIAAFGLTLVAGWLTSIQVALGIGGGLFLIWLGIASLVKAPAEQAATAGEAGTRGLARAYLTTLALTLTNPMTILAFAAILAGAGLLRDDGGVWGGMMLVAGVFLGSALWWLLLSGAVSLLRDRVTPQALRWVNRAAGALLAGFGVYAIWSTVAAL